MDPIQLTESKLRSLLREAYLAGFESTSEGYNGELGHDGFFDADQPKREAAAWARKKLQGE